MSKIKFQTSLVKNAIQLFGGNLEAYNSKEKIVILVGPAGSGKTWALCLLMHLFCVKYPGVQVLLCRKTLPALRNTVVKTYLGVVELTGYKDRVRTLGETRPTEFIYQQDEKEWDGIKYAGVSRITLSQIDANGKALGAEYDMIYVNQPDTEGLTEEEFTLVASRCRADNGPYRKILADPNPASDQHWILKGSYPHPQTNEAKWKLYNSTHKDNPAYFNHETEEWTDLGKEHLKQLELLPDHLKQSQLEGKWFSTEGTIFGTVFNPTKHILYYESQKAVDLGISNKIYQDDSDEPIYLRNNLQGWHNYVSIDWGGTDPFVCYDDKTEILTNEGWKLFNNLNKNEKVATINLDTKVLEFEKPLNYIKQLYKGDMILGESRSSGANFLVTPNHQMIVENHLSRKWNKVEASKLGKYNAIPISWNSPEKKEDSLFEIPNKLNATRKYLSPVSKKAFAKFIGIFLSEGYLKESKKGNKIRVVQKKYIEEVDKIFKDLGWNYNKYISKSGMVEFTIGALNLYEFLEEHCGKVKSQDKYIPRFIFDWGSEALNSLLDGLILGDGSYSKTKRKCNSYAGCSYVSTSKKLLDDIQQIACMLGYPTSISKKGYRGSYKPNGHVCYKLRFTTGRLANLQTLNPRRIDYNGYVYCVETSNSTVVIRRNGKTMVGGNCILVAHHPEQDVYIVHKHVYITETDIYKVSELTRDMIDGYEVKAVVTDRGRAEQTVMESIIGYPITTAKKGNNSVIESLNIMVAELNSNKWYFVNTKESLFHPPDPLLMEKKKLMGVEEIPNLKRDAKTGGIALKQQDHYSDCVRYLMRYLVDLNARPSYPTFVWI